MVVFPIFRPDVMPVSAVTLALSAESPRPVRGLQLAALLGRFAPCGACFVSAHERNSPFQSTRTAIAGHTPPQPIRSLRSLIPRTAAVAAREPRQRAPRGCCGLARAGSRAEGREPSARGMTEGAIATEGIGWGGVWLAVAVRSLVEWKGEARSRAVSDHYPSVARICRSACASEPRASSPQ
jgi:hypothetical protein